MTADPEDAALRGLHRAVALVGDHLPVVHGLKLVHLALLQHLLLAFTEIAAVLLPPPRHVLVVSVRVLRLQHERRHEFEDECLTVFETRVVQRPQVYDLRVFQPRDAVAVVALPAELEAVQGALIEREDVVAVGVEVRVDVPLRRLLLLPCVVGLPHDGLVGERRVAALHADVVRVQRVSRPGIEEPRMRRLPHQEQVVVGLDVGKPAPEVRSDAALRVLLGERPELAGHEDAVTRVQVAVDVVRELLSECVEDGVPRDVVRVADVVHLQLPLDLLDARHRWNASRKSSMYWSAVDHAPIRRRLASSTMSHLS